MVRFLVLQLCLMGATAFAVNVSLHAPGLDNVQRLKVLAQLSVVNLAAQLVVLRIVFRSLLTPAVIFSLLLSLFTSGWLLLHAFSISTAGVDVVGRLPVNLVVNAAVFYLNSYGFFCLGIVIVGGRIQFSERAAVGLVADPREARALHTVGWLCLLVGVLPYALVNYNNLKIVITDGYSAYYQDGARLGNGIMGLSYFFLVGLVFIGCSGGRERRLKATLVLSVVGGLRLLAGDRGEGLIMLLGAFLLWYSFKSAKDEMRKGRRMLVLYGVAAVLLTPFVGLLRHAMSGGKFDLRAALVDSNPLVETIHTLGITIFPLAQMFRLVPSEVDYLNGGSYVSGALRLLPEFLIPHSLERMTSDLLFASPSTWLMQYLGMTYGPGFTPFAEAYLNFGLVGGLLMMLVFGLLIGFSLSVPPSFSPVRIAFVVAFFILCGFSVRASSNIFLPYVFRFLLVPLFLVNVIRHTGRAPRYGVGKGAAPTSAFLN